jgi:hypothetical protein
MSKSPAAKKQTKTKRRKRPPKVGTVLYVEGLVPRIKPIIPQKVALEGADRALQIALGHSASLASALSDDALKQWVMEIANDYWFERAWYERLGPQHTSKEVLKVEKATTAFLKVLETTPGYVKAAISRRMHIQAPSGELLDGLKRTEEALMYLLRACQKVPKVAGRRGTREKRHVEITAQALTELWSDMSGKPFVFNLDTHQEPGRSIAFIYQGPLFVQKMIEAIDPEASEPGVIFGEVSNALKKVSESRKTSSGNSI